MKAVGLIVEYNPFHLGHLHHVQEARNVSEAECIIAVMSGTFLQRGEPAIIDKFHRAKAAMASGVDIVIELPYAYAVQSSKLFAEGAVKSLAHLGVSSLCFGSESGKMSDFLEAYARTKDNKQLYERVLHQYLDKGERFPVASQKAYEAIGLKNMNLMQPNNILGYSYVKAVKELGLHIDVLTIKRIKSAYHEPEIKQSIASATSIRKEIVKNGFSDKITGTLPESSLAQLKAYYQTAGLVHSWEDYFPLLRYQVLSKSTEQLRKIQGVDEGLEYRLKRTANEAVSFQHWLQLMSTKRYTITRLQRCFVHLLTNTQKSSIKKFTNDQPLPYIRLLGMSQLGRNYLNDQKKRLDIPIYTNLNKTNAEKLHLDEKAQQIFYTPLKIQKQTAFRKQEFQLPIFMNESS